jgi:hypothetical protein
VPDGSAGVALGLVGVTATDLSFQNVSGTNREYSEKNRDTRSSEGGFNDQLFFTNTNTVLALASMHQQSTTDELGLDSDSSLASNSHSIQAQPDTDLTDGESASLFGSVVNEDRSMEATVNEHGPMISDRAIGVADFDISADLSAPGGERTITELNVFNAERLLLVSLQSQPGFIGQQNGLVGVPPLQYCTRFGSGREPRKSKRGST